MYTKMHMLEKTQVPSGCLRRMCQQKQMSSMLEYASMTCSHLYAPALSSEMQCRFARSRLRRSLWPLPSIQIAARRRMPPMQFSQTQNTSLLLILTILCLLRIAPRHIRYASTIHALLHISPDCASGIIRTNDGSILDTRGMDGLEQSQA